jgi:hypothetical protein
MAKAKQPPGPLMDLGYMRKLGVQNLIAFCFNDTCRHQGLIDVSSYPPDTEVRWFRSRVVCAKCGGRGNKIDVRPNWKEQPPAESLTGKQWR